MIIIVGWVKSPIEMGDSVTGTLLCGGCVMCYLEQRNSASGDHDIVYARELHGVIRRRIIFCFLSAAWVCAETFCVFLDRGTLYVNRQSRVPVPQRNCLADVPYTRLILSMHYSAIYEFF